MGRVTRLCSYDREVLRHYANMSNVTRKEYAKRLHISWITLERYLCGERKIPAYIGELAYILSRHPRWIIKDIPDISSIRQTRRSLGLSMADCAAMIYYTLQAWARWEYGRHPICKPAIALWLIKINHPAYIKRMLKSHGTVKSQIK